MDEPIREETKETKPAENSIQKIYTIRDWKEYLGESLLIIFSVLLALILTEWLTRLHEQGETHDLLMNIRAELVKNKQSLSAQYEYEKMVIRRIDSFLVHKELQQQIVTNNEFHYKLIFPDGVLHGGDPSTVAWEVAKEHAISGRISFPLMSRLTDLYEDQGRIGKLEDKVGGVILDRDSRNPANTAVTLQLIRDNYKAWAFDRAPGLIFQYDEAVKAIDGGQ
jgi:hypothetical protein